MTGYPAIWLVLAQGLLTATLLVAPPMALAFGARLTTTAADVGLALTAWAGLAIGTIALFWPFEGDWADAAFRPIIGIRPVLVGGLAAALAIAFAQRRALASEAAARVGAAFLLGALWGAVWGFAGWCLHQLEVSFYG